MQYEIVFGTTPSSLEFQINKRINNGWKLQGGASAVNTSIVRNNEIRYMQAMVKD